MDSAQRCDNGPSFEGVSSSFNEDSSVRRKKSHNWMESSRGEDRSVTTEGQQAGDLIFQNITLWSGGRNCRRRSPINGHFCRSIQQQRNCNWDGTGRRLQTPETDCGVFRTRQEQSPIVSFSQGCPQILCPCRPIAQHQVSCPEVFGAHPSSRLLRSSPRNLRQRENNLRKIQHQ